MVARAERSGPHCFTPVPGGVGLAARCPGKKAGCNAPALSTEELLRMPLRSAFGYSDPQRTGTLGSLET